MSSPSLQYRLQMGDHPWPGLSSKVCPNPAPDWNPTPLHAGPNQEVELTIADHKVGPMYNPIVPTASDLMADLAEEAFKQDCPLPGVHPTAAGASSRDSTPVASPFPDRSRHRQCDMDRRTSYYTSRNSVINSYIKLVVSQTPSEGSSDAVQGDWDPFAQDSCPVDGPQDTDVPRLPPNFGAGGLCLDHIDRKLWNFRKPFPSASSPLVSIALEIWFTDRRRRQQMFMPSAPGEC